jgi:hypothetical protein
MFDDLMDSIEEEEVLGEEEEWSTGNEPWSTGQEPDIWNSGSS